MKIRREQKPNWKDRPKTSGYEVIVPPGDDAMKHYKRLKKQYLNLSPEARPLFLEKLRETYNI